MKNGQDFIWHLLIGVLMVFFGGWVLGSVLNFAAMANPQMVSKIFCPEGSTVLKASEISCRDQNGATVPTLTEAESVVLQREYFYRPSFLLMMILVIGWFIGSSGWKIMRRQASL